MATRNGVIGNIITRTYSNFRGIDLLNNENNVDLTRSPDCLNVWKSYASKESNIIQSRPGIKKIINLGNDKVFNMYVYSQDTVIVHIGTKLIKWTGFPNDNFGIEILKENMARNKSVMIFFKSKIYILDGVNYLVYDGNTIKDVSDEAYIPTTTIGRSPSGGGELLEDVNLLSSKRKNSFIGDGEATEYFLDATNISSVDKVYVNDEEITEYEINLITGKVTFTEAPSVPNIIGQDNVVIEFTKKVEGYKERILNCTIATVFDNRIFFTGNVDYPNAIFHCSLNNPAFISDLDYYECGSQENSIKAMIIGNNLLWVFKEENQTKDSIFYLTPSLDTEYGRIYPTSQGNVSVGCYSTAINYKDTLLFFSRNGLEGINGNIAYEQSVIHKSSMIDSKLINMSNYEFLNLVEYNGYLMVSIDDTIFLADYRQTFNGNTGREYEWYLWQLPVNISCLKVYKNDLYFTDIEGNFYILEGTNDNGEPIESYWTTPRDVFGYINHLKKINKRGAIIKVKNMMNGKIKIAEKTNKRNDYKLVKEASSSGFDFNSIDFANFSFVAGDNSYIVYRMKEKKIIDISIKIYSDELNKPFGLVSITAESFISGYVKRS